MLERDLLLAVFYFVLVWAIIQAARQISTHFLLVADAVLAVRGITSVLVAWEWLLESRFQICYYSYD